MKRAAQQSVTTNRLRAGVRNSLIIGVGLLVAACQSQSQSSSSSMPSPSSPSSASSSSPSNPSPPSSSSSSSSSPSMPSSSQSSSPSSRSSSQPPSMPSASSSSHLARHLARRQAHRRAQECLRAQAATPAHPAQLQARHQVPDSRAVCRASARACQAAVIYRVLTGRAWAPTPHQAHLQAPQEEIARPATLVAKVDNQARVLRY